MQRNKDVSRRQIEVFHMVMRLESANRAAAALHISQLAVTQTLQQMEARSGLKLFDRNRGRLMPTSEAQALMDEVERVYDGLECIQRKIQALQPHEQTVLRIGSLHALASSVMPWAIAEFQRSYPRTRCQLLVERSKSLRDALRQGAIDLAFLGDEADTNGLVASPFYEVPGVCIMPTTHPLTRKPSLGARDLQEVPLTGLSAHDAAQRRLEASLAQAGVPARFVVETPYSATQCALVLAGAGLVVTNPLVAHKYAMLGLRSVPWRSMSLFASCWHSIHARPSHAPERNSPVCADGDWHSAVPLARQRIERLWPDGMAGRSWHRSGERGRYSSPIATQHAVAAP